MEGPRAKRQKVAVACDNCRSRKVKCDGREPICEPCQRRFGGDALCTWNTSSSHIPLGNSTDRMRSEDGRARQPDQNNFHAYQPPKDSRSMVTAFDSSIPQTVRVNASNDLNVDELSMYQSTSSVIAYEGTQLSIPATSSLPVDNLLGEEASRSTDNMFPLGYPPDLTFQSDHATIRPFLEQSRREDLPGNYGSRNLMEEVKKMVEHNFQGMSPRHSYPSTQKQDGLPPLYPNHKGTSQKSDYTLPPRKQADRLMDAYWRYLHVLHPHLDKAQTQEDYEKIWIGDDSVTDERSFLCLLNSILAISCRLIGLPASEERDRSASTFHLRARQLVDVGEMASIRSVQIFLLLAQYFQSTSQSPQFSIFVGLAIRTAQSLGLHLLSTSECISNAHTRELLRKVWHGCVLMDRVLALTYRQPCTISTKTASTVPLPLAIDEEDLRQGSVLQHVVEAQQSSTVDFYISSLKLYEILQDATFISDFTNPQSQSIDESHDTDSGQLSSTEGRCSIYEVERRLSRWEKDLPDHLKIGNHAPNEAADSVLYRQTVVLHQRHLHTHLLLLRPFLPTFVISDLTDAGKPVPFGSMFTNHTSLQCVIACAKISQEAIDIIYREIVNRVGKVVSFSSWWDHVQYVYTSATILIAARLSPSVLAEVPDKSLLDGLHKAVEILELYKNFSASIPRLTATLRLLVEIVPRKYSRLYAQPRDNTNTAPETEIPSISGATFSIWCPLKPKGSLSHPPHQTSRPSDLDKDQSAFSDVRAKSDFPFNPEDFTWLLTIPLET